MFRRLELSVPYFIKRSNERKLKGRTFELNNQAELFVKLFINSYLLKLQTLHELWLTMKQIDKRPSLFEVRLKLFSTLIKTASCLLLMMQSKSFFKVAVKHRSMFHERYHPYILRKTFVFALQYARRVRAHTSPREYHIRENFARSRTARIDRSFKQYLSIFRLHKPIDAVFRIGANRSIGVYFAPLSDNSALRIRVRFPSKDAYSIDTPPFRKPCSVRRVAPSKTVCVRLTSRL